MLKVLKFRYFLVLLLLCSCGGKAEKKPETAPVANEEGATPVPKESDGKVILFFGNSLTAGYGLDTQEAFPALIQNRLDSLGLDYTVVNSGISGETTTGGKNRLDWVLNQDIAIFILELGANDGLRGIPLNETRNNLQEIIDAVHGKNGETKIILAGMQIPPNMGADYTAEFKSIFPDLAKANNIELIPFLLDGVAGIPELNQQDGIHPTVAGQKIVANNVWAVLGDMVE